MEITAKVLQELAKKGIYVSSLPWPQPKKGSKK